MNEAEIKPDIELDLMCDLLEVLDSVEEGDLQWSHKETTVHAVKLASADDRKKQGGGAAEKAK